VDAINNAIFKLKNKTNINNNIISRMSMKFF